MSVGGLEIKDTLDCQDNMIIEAGNNAHALAQKMPVYERVPLTVIDRDQEGCIRAGLKGETFRGWLYIDVLWVKENMRGQGMGRKLVQAAEAEALKRGCHSVYLWTQSYQAPNYYSKLGYKEFAVLPDFPIGSTRTGFMKSLKKVAS